MLQGDVKMYNFAFLLLSYLAVRLYRLPRADILRWQMQYIYSTNRLTVYAFIQTLRPYTYAETDSEE